MAITCNHHIKNQLTCCLQPWGEGNEDQFALGKPQKSLHWSATPDVKHSLLPETLRETDCMRISNMSSKKQVETTPDCFFGTIKRHFNDFLKYGSSAQVRWRVHGYDQNWGILCQINIVSGVSGSFTQRSSVGVCKPDWKTHCERDYPGWISKWQQG